MVGCFLGIRGAFYNMSYEGIICNAAVKSVNSDIIDQSISFSATRCCMQEGFIFLMVDELLLDTNGFEFQGDADDIAVILI